MAEIVWPTEIIEAYNNSPEVVAARNAQDEWFRAKMLEGSPFLQAIAEDDDQTSD